MRSSAIFLIAAAAACGPTVLVEGEPSDGAFSGAGGDGFSAGGNGAANGSGSGAGSGSGSGSGAGNGGKAQWAKALGAEGHQHLRALAADHAGNVIAAGDFDGTLDPGTGPLAQTGVRSGFVIKLDPAGKVIWSQALTADDCVAEAVAVNAADEVLLTGFVKGSLHLGGQQIPDGDGIFVAKLDAEGLPIWTRTFGSSSGKQGDRGLSIAGLPDGGAVFSGSFEGSLDIDAPVPADHGVFVAKLSGEGDGVWVNALPATTGVVAASPKGHAVVATSDGGSTMSVYDVDPAGAVIWSHAYGPGTFSAVAVDPAGNALLAGSTTTADFGGGPLPSPLPNGEGFLVSLDPQGKHRYTRGLPFDTTQSSAVAVTVDAAGRVGVTGSYVHYVDGSTAIQSAFLVTFDQAGAKLASHTFGPTDGLGGKVTQAGRGLAPAPAGGLYLGGDFFTAIEVAGTTLKGGGTADVFVARLAP